MLAQRLLLARAGGRQAASIATTTAASNSSRRAAALSTLQRGLVASRNDMGYGGAAPHRRYSLAPAAVGPQLRARCVYQCMVLVDR